MSQIYAVAYIDLSGSEIHPCVKFFLDEDEANACYEKMRREYRPSFRYTGIDYDGTDYSNLPLTFSKEHLFSIDVDGSTKVETEVIDKLEEKYDLAYIHPAHKFMVSMPTYSDTLEKYEPEVHMYSFFFENDVSLDIKKILDIVSNKGMDLSHE